MYGLKQKIQILKLINRPLTPSYLSVNRKDVYTHPDDEITFIKQIKNFINKKFFITGFLFIFVKYFIDII